MKKNYLLILALFLATTLVEGQVTIGSDTPPANGALLDLKDGGTYTNGVTASKGLGMPRVKLTDVDNLYPMFVGTETDYATQKTAHTGLIVYQVSGDANPKCAPIPDGLYIWDGGKWNGIGSKAGATPGTANVTKTYIDLLSGKDSRGAISAQTFDVTWSPANQLAYRSAAVTGGGVPFSVGNITPSPLATSPATFSMTPNIMTINATYPWQSKETTLTFDVTDECGKNPVSKTVTLNQTNYALKVNDQFSSNQFAYTTFGTNSFAIQGNVTWTTSKSDPIGILSTTTPVVGVEGGENKKDGTTGAPIPNFLLGSVSGIKYDVAYITFKDTESTKRFDDITVSVINCTENDPSLDAWALRAGFTQAEINSVATGGTHAKTQPNGIQLHKDQSGNLFLSGLFGTQRWMLNNLAATAYVKPHSQGRVLTFSYDSGYGTYNVAYYSYPNLTGTKTATLYNNNPRLGLLYNWDAATGGKGGANGLAMFPDGEKTSTPNVDPQITQVQGICPAGWHLPSDWEWTQLEKEINANTSKYSTLEDANADILVGGFQYRGTTHGLGMRDSCPPPGQTEFPSSIGMSNAISDSIAPGFNVLRAGSAAGGGAGGLGRDAYFWTASGEDIMEGYGKRTWDRGFLPSNIRLNRNNNPRHKMVSIRCKK